LINLHGLQESGGLGFHVGSAGVNDFGEKHGLALLNPFTVPERLALPTNVEGAGDQFAALWAFPWCLRVGWGWFLQFRQDLAD
jgi:hypothetical protein